MCIYVLISIFISIFIMKKLLSQIFYNNDFIKNYYKKQFGSFYRQINNLKGGGFNVEYKNNIIKFDKIIDEDRITLYLSTIDKKDNCIIIIIDKDTNTAYIEGITNNKYNNCFDTPVLNNGKVIMEITIKMLKKYQDKLKIKSINLKDNSYEEVYPNLFIKLIGRNEKINDFSLHRINSFIQCSDKVKIWLANLSFLQYNDTFYGRFGFIPIEEDIYIKFLENKEILKSKFVKSIDFKNIIEQNKNNIDDRLKAKMIHNYERHKNDNIVEWFNNFSKKYMKADCVFFNYLIEYIYKELKLNIMKGESFVIRL
jgi:hypothetical protein